MSEKCIICNILRVRLYPYDTIILCRGKIIVLYCIVSRLNFKYTFIQFIFKLSLKNNLYLNLSIYEAIIVFGMDLFVSHVCVDEVKLLLSSVQLHRTKEVLLEKTMLSSPHTIALVFSTIMKNQNSHCLYY